MIKNNRSSGSAVCVKSAELSNRLIYFALWSAFLSLLLLGSMAPVSAATDEERLRAAMNVVVMLLLDEEPPIPRPDGFGVKLDLGDAPDDTYDVSRGNLFFAEFDRQAVGVELCFSVASTGSIPQGGAVIRVNGRAERLRIGENCFQLNPGAQREVNYIEVEVLSGSITLSLTTLELQSVNQNQLRLPRLTRGEWNQSAVRKVLKIFAFGGHPTGRQIRLWADMKPAQAIRQMLNFNEHNLRLSPFVADEEYTDVRNIPGTFRAYIDFITSDTSNLPLNTGDDRANFSDQGYRFEEGFGRMAVTRGLNPFRQRIGFWETNYHLAVNLDTQVERPQVVTYYDAIMEAHEAGLPYKDVMGVAAKSAAVATQYGHRRNRWIFRDGEYKCDCNDDFAREIHQLFYGIFGTNDPNHEDGTIRETAKMLTDMRVDYIQDQGLETAVTFGTQFHHTDNLTILGRSISGGNASAKIDNLMPISMQHPESLENLPVMIIETLADDKLTEYKRNQLRASWASMGVNRKLLDFIHAYAISELFHDSSHFKYLTSFERAFYVANRYNLNNIEAYYSNDFRVGRATDRVFSDDNSNEVFRPLHNVFGGQTSMEASDSAVAFEKNYNRSAPTRNYQFRNEVRVECDDCNAGGAWKKDWAQVIPRSGGSYPAGHVARWLWNHVIGNTTNYSALEHGHLVAILGANRVQPDQDWDRFQFMDLNYLLCLRADRISKGENSNSLGVLMSEPVWDRFCRHGDDGNSDYSNVEKQAFNLPLTGDTMTDTPYIESLIDQLAAAQVPLNSSDELERRRANERIHAAMAFIFATPFVFAEGR